MSDESLYVGPLPEPQRIKTKPSQDIVCPFCGEKSFDLVGLKFHLISGWCEPFDNTDVSVCRRMP